MDYNALLGLVGKHLRHSHSGKVRDTFQLPSGGEDLRLVLVSDRTSIFDFTLLFPIPGKGPLINAFNIAARLYLRRTLPTLEDDMVAYGSHMDDYLADWPELRDSTALRERAVIVSPLTMLPVELIVRGYLTGTGYTAYKKTGKLCGHELPEGLVEGKSLGSGLFTPTTKAAPGVHDEHLDYKEVIEMHGGDAKRWPVHIYSILRRHAFDRGILLVDTKLEMGRRSGAGNLILADEVCTPDSSRFWEQREYDRLFPGQLPPSMDKQALRNWGKTLNMHTMDPKNRDHYRFVQSLSAPADVVAQMSADTHRAFQMLWGKTLPEFQSAVMGISP